MTGTAYFKKTSNYLLFFYLLFFLVLFSCKDDKVEEYKADNKSDINSKTVAIVKEGDKFQLYRHGKPYFIKGAGGYEHYDKIKQFGGNSIRVWTSHNAKEILDEAHKHGLTVTLGLNVAHERHGFDYSDKNAVAKQFEEVKEVVMAYKDHPALLMWGVGNELEMLSSNLMVWRAVNDIAKMIHEVDPNHPTTTMISVMGKKNAMTIKLLAPHIDIISVNTLKSLIELPAKVKDSGWDGPYVVTEWGPTGFWESPRTAWDVAVEETSTEKAAMYKIRYEYSIKQDNNKCLGSYVFYWGQKQERTPTWFSLFIPSGEKTEVVDVMQYLWTGTWPENRCPKINSLLINGKNVYDDIILNIKDTNEAVVNVVDPENDQLHYKWEILNELTGKKLKEGGDAEEKPKPIDGLIVKNLNNKIEFYTPPQEGPYRLYVYIYDGNNNVGTANFPFYVVY